MYKLCKWIYRSGVLHERRRIKLLIAEHRGNKPDRDDWKYNNSGVGSANDYDFDLAVWMQAGRELQMLVEPPQLYTQEMPVPAPIDEDDHAK